MELAVALGMVDASWSPEFATDVPLVASADVGIPDARDAGLLRAEGVPSLGDRVAVVAVIVSRPIPGAPWRRRAGRFPIRSGSTSTSTSEALPAVDYPQPRRPRLG